MNNANKYTGSPKRRNRIAGTMLAAGIAITGCSSDRPTTESVPATSTTIKPVQETTTSVKGGVNETLTTMPATMRETLNTSVVKSLNGYSETIQSIAARASKDTYSQAVANQDGSVTTFITKYLQSVDGSYVRLYASIDYSSAPTAENPGASQIDSIYVSKDVITDIDNEPAYGTDVSVSLIRFEENDWRLVSRDLDEPDASYYSTEPLPGTQDVVKPLNTEQLTEGQVDIAGILEELNTVPGVDLTTGPISEPI